MQVGAAQEEVDRGERTLLLAIAFSKHTQALTIGY
jgi:hypothetical protein